MAKVEAKKIIKKKKPNIKIIRNPTGFCKLANEVGDEIYIESELAERLIKNKYAVQI